MRLGLLLVVAAACGGSPPSASRPSPGAAVRGTHRLTVDGVDIAFEVRGTGPICLAHPGGPGLSARYLQSEALERRFTMVYIDPIGTGASGSLPAGERYSMDRDVKVLDALRKELKVERACLVGHSYGGFVVLRYAVEHPANVRGMLLYSTAAATDEAWEKSVGSNMQWFKHEPWFADATRGLAAEEAATNDAELAAALGLEWPMFFADWSGHRAAYAPLFAQLAVSFDVYRRRVEGVKYDVRQRLGVVHTTPTVIVTGDRDISCGAQPAAELARAIGGSQVVVIERAGHFAHVEQPAAFDAAVETFAAALK